MSISASPLNSTPNRLVVLGSSSRYRRELLERLRIPFTVESPHVDETPLAGEAPAALARRLALAKAQAVAQRFPDCVVIGSDQVADLNGVPLGKPGNHASALAQLRKMRGRRVVFHTALCLYDGRAATFLDDAEGEPREQESEQLGGVYQRFRLCE